MRVRTAILQHLHAERPDLAVAVAPEFEVDPLGTAMVHRDHVLAPRLRPADGPARCSRQRADQHVIDVESLSTEAAADIGCDDPHIVGLESQHRAEDGLVLMGGLRREVDREPSVAELRERRARLDRTGEQARALGRARDHDFAIVEEMLVRIVDSDVAADVGSDLLVHDELVLEGFVHVDDDRQRVVFDLDELHRIDGRLARVGDHRGDDVADEPDASGRERRPRHPRVDAHEFGRDIEGQGQILGGEDLDSGPCESRRRVDREDVGVREHRSDERDVQFAGDMDVVDVPTSTE